MPSGRSGPVPEAACNSVSVTSDTSSIPAHVRRFNMLPNDKSKPEGLRWFYGICCSPHSLSSCTTSSSSSCTTSTLGCSASLFWREKVTHILYIFFACWYLTMEERKPTANTHLVRLLLFPAEAVITLRVGFHGHAGEEVLHGIVAKIITDGAKL